MLGCRLFIKEVTNRSLIEKDNSLCDGDIVLKVLKKTSGFRKSLKRTFFRAQINNTAAENLSLKEAKKLIESSKELHFYIKRERSVMHVNHLNEMQMNGQSYPTNLYENTIAVNKQNGHHLEAVNGTRANWNSNQNLYVQPPTRGN